LRCIVRGGKPESAAKRDVFGREGRLMTLFHARR
jgi:hypothetical protein